MVHLVFVCKYRKRLLLKYGKDIKIMFTDISEEYDIGIIQMETDKDHVHLLIQYPPTKSVLEIVRLFKQISTYRIWRLNHAEKCLPKHFWSGKTFWSDGYFACSIGQVSKDIVEKYIQNQG